MVFWIVIALIAIAVVWSFVYNFMEWDEFGISLAGAFLALVISAVAGAVVMLLFSLIPAQKVTQATYELRAIGSSDTVSGRFFLGSGYVEGKRTLNFIRQGDGFAQLDSAYASASRIYEDSAEPTFIEYTTTYSNPWVLPWEIVIGYSYDFHIPKGSILENYTIDNE